MNSQTSNQLKKINTRQGRDGAMNDRCDVLVSIKYESHPISIYKRCQAMDVSQYLPSLKLFSHTSRDETVSKIVLQVKFRVRALNN